MEIVDGAAKAEIPGIPGIGLGKVLIGYASPGTVDSLFHESIVQTLTHDALTSRRIIEGGGHISVLSGPRISSARNDICRHFLSHPNRPEWLWMLDADMTFPAGTLDALIDNADSETRPIVGGLCFGGGRSGVVFPTLYRIVDPKLAESGAISIIEKYPENALCKVSGTGAACLLIHRSALITIEARFGKVEKADGRVFTNPHPWFIESVFNGREFGEDLTFSLRAGQCGIPIYVHTGIHVGHVKPAILDEDAFARYKAKERLMGEQGVRDLYKAQIGLAVDRKKSANHRPPRKKRRR